MLKSSGVLSGRTAAMLGLAGAVLSGVGDVLILGRGCSGREFDDATGRIPQNIDADPRWRSLWNGASVAPGRLQVGTVIGVVGIGVLQSAGLRAALVAAIRHGDAGVQRDRDRGSRAGSGLDADGAGGRDALSCVLATLLTFGALPAPIGGYTRPASMSIGLAVSFAVSVVSSPGISESSSRPV